MPPTPKHSTSSSIASTTTLFGSSTSTRWMNLQPVEGATNEDGRIPSIWDTFTLAEPVSRHMEDQGLEFLQFSFHWFNYLLIREVIRTIPLQCPSEGKSFKSFQRTLHQWWFSS
ncbi:hypothetical protein CRYUN_Cryun10bG0082900 [Craigia yunnanensis]